MPLSKGKNIWLSALQQVAMGYLWANQEGYMPLLLILKVLLTKQILIMNRLQYMQGLSQNLPKAYSKC